MVLFWESLQTFQFFKLNLCVMLGILGRHELSNKHLKSYREFWAEAFINFQIDSRHTDSVHEDANEHIFKIGLNTPLNLSAVTKKVKTEHWWLKTWQ